jgi:hypothetical protein
MPFVGRRIGCNQNAGGISALPVPDILQAAAGHFLSEF